MKKHESPEFQVIRQKEANAKFFVASTPPPAPLPQAEGNSQLDQMDQGHVDFN